MKLKLLFLTLITVNFLFAQEWTEQATSFGTPSRGLNSISIVNSNVVWASAYDGSGADPANDPNARISDFTKTVDGGLTWTAGSLNPDPNLRIAMIQGMSMDKAWAIGYKNSGTFNTGVWATVDGGNSWTRQTTASFSGSGAFPNVLHFWNENVGFCQGDPVGGYFELYTTSDGGVNWTRVPSANIPTPLTDEYGYVSQIFHSGNGNRIWWTTNKGRIFRSDDFGLNWDVFQSPIPDFGSASSSGEISFWDDNNGMLINQDGALFSTVDGGENWTPVFPNSGDVYGSDISCIPGTSIVVSSGQLHGGGTDRGSSFSVDRGLNWVTLDNAVDHLDVEFIDINTGWTAGFNTDATTGGIFKYTGTQLAAAAAVGSNELSIANAYPNPVKDIFTIEGVDIISNVTVFNMLGQEVLTTQPNVLTAKIDMSNLTSGSYVVKATVNGNTQTIKLIK